MTLSREDASNSIKVNQNKKNNVYIQVNFTILPVINTKTKIIILLQIIVGKF